MARRLVTAILLLALIVPVIIVGGIFYVALVCVGMGMAAWEYDRIFRRARFFPSIWLVVGGSLLLLVVRALRPGWLDWTFTVLVLAAMVVFTAAYEAGRHDAALDFVITVGGFTYLGWIGGYMLDLRSLPLGGWWVMVVFPVVWLADTGAYVIGARYGQHKMFKRISPKKSWEGFAAGVFMGTVYGGFFAFTYSHFGPLHLTILQGLVLGFVLSTSTVLGDLGISLLKRFADTKDSGDLLPGHGGVLDRLDSLIWAAVIGVLWIRLFLL